MTDIGVTPPIHKNIKSTLPRINNFYTSTRFQDANLLGKLYSEPQTVTLSHWALPGGEGAWQDYTFDQIITQTFDSVEVGSSYGPTWSTHWFKVEFTIPEEWAGEEVRFRWDSNGEATFWSATGEVLQGFSTNQKRSEYVLYSSYPGGIGAQTYYVEMTVSRMFGAAADNDNITPPDPNLYLTLSTAELVTMDKTIYKLIRDLDVLYQLADNLLPDDARGYMAMDTGNQMVNSIIKGDYSGASALGDQYFAKGNGERAHTLAAIGNCHIDTAWLWPYSETKRKVARSFASQLKLLENYDGFKFVASQAQQWAWLQEYYPELFARVKAKVEEGTFLPVGTTWIEMDGNIPSGESFIRQFFYGRKYYLNELNYICKEFWLPDTFGYSAQIPALMRHVGIERFLTQKMSWSLVNKFPHHNFIWEGIDGSVVQAHFPPGDSYTMNCNVDEYMRSVSNLEDKGRVSISAYLFGYGDGGGGPSQDMIERNIRAANTDGCPKVEMTTPNALFDKLELEKDNLMKWVGELFLELHNGTYTSQADMKRLCRSAEFHLRDAEFLLTNTILNLGASSLPLVNSSLTTLEEAWKKVLLNQFHDVLPGSGIGIIYPEATQYYNEAIDSANTVYQNSADATFGTSTTTSQVAMNTLQWPRKEIVEVDAGVLRKLKKRLTGQKGKAVEYFMVDAPGFGYAALGSGTPSNDVTVASSNGQVTMTNGLLEAKISAEGQITSLKVAGGSRDLLVGTENKFGNTMTLYDDEPLYWDAWDIMDYHLETAVPLNESGSTNVTSPVTILENGPMVGRLTWSLSIGEKSTMTQEIVMKADCPYLIFETTIDWQESHKVLKTVFDSNLLVRNASFDIQFGFLERPTHMNTSWDTARYEVCGHKWADISEPNVGMAILNDSKYGWCGRGSALSLTLLKAPKAPDDNCDMKVHTIKYAVMPHTGTLQDAEVMRHGYEFNNPLRLTDVPSDFVSANPTWTSNVVIDGTGIVLHTIKPTDDGSNNVILRMFESNGCRSSATITIKALVSAFETDGLEVAGSPLTTTVEDGATVIPVNLSPFQIYAIRLESPTK